MSVARRPERPPNPLVWLLDRLGPIFLTIIAGIVLGLQFIMPNKRVIPVLSVIVMFGLIWRVDMIAGLGVLALALPFPRNMSLGSTNLAFIAVLAILWLLRVSNGLSLRPRSSPLDAPVLALFVAYVVSFYNVTTAQAMSQAVPIFQIRAAAMLMLFMIVTHARP